MRTLKQEAINVISNLPDTAGVDEIMYQLYVLSKIRKGQEAIENGEYTTIEDLKKEIDLW